VGREARDVVERFFVEKVTGERGRRFPGPKEEGKVTIPLKMTGN